MAKKKSEQNTTNAQNQNGETVAGYFRKVFGENPKLLNEKSNDQILQRWLLDHPGFTEVPQSVKGSLSNIKSTLRSEKRRKVARRAELAESVGQQKTVKVARVPTGGSDLERLEHQIDECLILAKHLDREGLESVIQHLRRARNEVVWKLGQ